jgi:hypothetical protein
MSFESFEDKDMWFGEDEAKYAARDDRFSSSSSAAKSIALLSTLVDEIAHAMDLLNADFFIARGQTFGVDGDLSTDRKMLAEQRVELIQLFRSVMGSGDIKGSFTRLQELLDEVEATQPIPNPDPIQLSDEDWGDAVLDGPDSLAMYDTVLGRPSSSSSTGGGY